MAQVVQAACPGCKAVLRIPSEWLHQPIRCKACGTVVQAQAPRSPVPPTRPAAPRQASRPAPPPPPPPPAPTASIAVAPPLAAPLAPAGSPFDFDEPAMDTPVATVRRRPRKKSGS